MIDEVELMNCPLCVGANSKTALYCEHCGEPLTVAAAAARREKERREKQTRENELTEAVATRLMKWAKIFLFVTAIPIALLLIVIGKATFSDIPKSVEAAKAEINASKASALSNIAAIQMQLTPIQNRVTLIQSDLTQYQQVNSEIGKLQSSLKQVQGDIIDIGKKTLKVGKIEAVDVITAGAGKPLLLEGGMTGCVRKELTNQNAYGLCVQGSPLALSQMTPDGRTRPVA
ncbi:MAG: hypothetical protein WB679_02055, partial [Terracidiphilus sp.]